MASTGQGELSSTLWSREPSQFPATVRSILDSIVGRLAPMATKAGSSWRQSRTRRNPPLEMAKKGHEELLRVMALTGYEVVS